MIDVDAGRAKDEGKSEFQYSIPPPPCSEDLEKILGIFNIAVSNDADSEAMQDRCFQAVLNACKNAEWEKIESIKDSILGLNHHSKSVFEVFVKKGDKEKIKQLIQQKFELVDELSNYASHLGLHFAAQKRSF